MKKISPNIKVAYLQVELHSEGIPFSYQGDLKEWLTLERLTKLVIDNHPAMWPYFIGRKEIKIFWLGNDEIAVGAGNFDLRLRVKA